jgi:signal peptidase I
MAAHLMRNMFQQAIVAAITLIVLHTWLVLGCVVPVTVSGSSMAPTLLGPHRLYRCPDCFFQFPVGMDQLPLGEVALCPECGQRRATIAPGADQHGEQMAIDRTAFMWHFPGRWEVVVFRSPELGGELCVKRIVGLPGEIVSLQAGDVLIDGQIVRKSLAEQTAVRQLVCAVSKDVGALNARAGLVLDSKLGQWRIGKTQFETSGDDSRTFNLLEYHHEGMLLDEHSFNQGATPPQNSVADIMLTFSARFTGEGRLVLGAQQLSKRWEVIIDFGRTVVELRRDGQMLIDQLLPACASRARFGNWTFSLFDQQVLLAIDNHVILAEPWEVDQVSLQADAKSELPPMFSLGLDRLDGEVRSTAVWRDIYYAVRHSDGHQAGAERGAMTSWQLGPDEFFVLGDNAPISDDSRSWLSGPGVDAKLLIGKPLGVR